LQKFGRLGERYGLACNGEVAGHGLGYERDPHGCARLDVGARLIERKTAHAAKGDHEQNYQKRDKPLDVRFAVDKARIARMDE
jgi:hypothetical protein